MKKLLVILCFLIAQLNAADNPVSINQQVHEAFVSKIADVTPQEILTRQPPAPKAETPPKQPNTQTIWIPGYWSWIHEKQDFVWVCGVWRLPPPDHFWLAGFWKEEKSGWTWVKGAWLENKFKDTSKLVYTNVAPPATQNENVGTSPGPDYFWSMGYWQFEPGTKTHKWLNGSWQKFNPKWVFEAGHWIWRPEGYLFVSPCWDWPLEQRGQTYDCYSQEPLPASSVAQNLTSCYPDYIAECNWCRHYCPEVWAGCDCLPPWWVWDDWWSLPSGDGWWLWWWWLHDGYPYPPFIIDIFDLIPPPTIIIIDVFAGLNQPLWITPNGVPSIDQWIDAIIDAMGGNQPNGPFLPPDLIDQILDAIEKALPETGTDRPHGNPNGGHVTKPASPHVTPGSGPAAIPHTPSASAPAPAHIPEVPQATPPPPPPIITQPPTVIRQPPVQHTPRYRPPVYQPPIYQQPGYNHPPIRYPPGYGPQHRQPGHNKPQIYINWGGGHGGRQGGGHSGGHQGQTGGHQGGGQHQPTQKYINVR